MPKKKKTRKQKALSDLRQKAPDSKRETTLSQEPIAEEENPRSGMYTFTLQTTKITSSNAPTKNAHNNEHSFIAHDLKKTALLTTTIVALQLILFFFMNRP